jgi:hypothetical protein
MQPEVSDIMDLTITLAATVVRNFTLVKLLVVATRGSRGITNACALKIDSKLALATKLI